MSSWRTANFAAAIALVVVFSAVAAAADGSSVIVIENAGAALPLDGAYTLTDGQLRRSPLAALSSGSASPTDLLAVNVVPADVRPTAMSYAAGVLVFYDSVTRKIIMRHADGSVSSVDNTQLDGADGIAFDATTGVVVLTASASGAAVVWSRAAFDGSSTNATPPARKLHLPGQPIDPIFDNGDLLFLDRLGGEILFASGVGAKSGMSPVAPAVSRLLTQQLGSVDAFSAYRGVLYIAAANGVAVISRTSPSLLWITATDFAAALAKVRVRAVAASEGWLVLLDQGGALRAVGRPVPAVVSLEGMNQSERESALIGLYRRLLDLGILQVAAVPVSVDLTAGQVARSLLSDKDHSGGLRPSATLIRELSRVITTLTSVAAAGQPEATVLRAGTTVKVPVVAVASKLQWRPVELNGDTIEAWLLKNGINIREEADQLAYGQALLDRNPVSQNTLSSLLRGAGLEPTQARTPVQMGDVIGWSGSGLKVFGNVGACGAGAPTVTSRGVNLGPYVDTVKEEGLITANVGGLAPQGDSWRARLYVNRANRWSAGDDLRPYDGCAVLKGNDRFVVTDTLTAQDIQLQFVDAGGAPQNGITPQMVESLKSRPDSSDAASLQVDTPWVVGYRVTPAQSDRGPSRRIVAARGAPDLTDLKGRHTGRAILPLPTWEVAVFIPRGQLKDSIEQLRKDHSMLFVFPTERLAITPAIDTDFEASDQDQSSEAPKTLLENRRWLREMISFPPPSVYDPPLSTVKIGLAERLESLNWHNEDLKRVQWSDVKELSPPAGCGPEAVADDLDEAEKDLAKCHHATFMAGLLVGQAADDSSGLVQNVTIVPIDTSGDYLKLNEEVGKAVDQQCRIINFSQIIRDGQLFEEFEAKVQSVWSRVLFVGPANKMDAVNAAGRPKPLLSYQTTSVGFDHIIGVAPTHTDRSSLDKYSTNANYVQLAALGENVWSSVGERHHMGAKGASIAVPLVTAAAAMINPNGTIEDGRILKARLIYTADSLSEETVKRTPPEIWGGYLNVRRAVRTRKELLMLPGSPREELEIEPDCPLIEKACELTIVNGKNVHWSDQSEKISQREPVPFANILRIVRSSGLETTYRVVFMRGGVMRNVIGATLEGTLRYKPVSMLNLDTKLASPISNSPARRHEWAEILDYTARLGRVAVASF